MSFPYHRGGHAPLSSSQCLPPVSASSTLRDAALAPSTLRAYTTHLDRFLTHTRLSLNHLLKLQPARIDALLAAYIDAQFAARGSYDYACQTVFGLIYRCPALRLQLGEARLRLRGWKRLRRSRSHPPITWELTALFACVMSKWGRHAEAVATLLAFDCYLRVGELTRLTYADVAQPHDPRFGDAHRSMALRLAVTKTGPHQSVDVKRLAVARVLLAYLKQFPFLADDRIFAFTPTSFRTLLSQVALSVGLGHIAYVPHSFRHGGATSDFLSGATIEQVQYRGRWESMRSARRYIQTARALLILQDVPRALNDAGRVLARQIGPLLRLLWDSVPSKRRPAVTRRGRRVLFAH